MKNNKGKSIHPIHDNLYKSVFSRVDVAHDFLLGRLPKDLVAKMDLSTLEPQKDTFIDGNLITSCSDMLYSVKIDRGRAYLYFLIEHQNKADELMPLRILSYMVEIMRQHVKKRPKSVSSKTLKLPIVIPFVLYAGKADYVYPVRLIDSFEVPDIFYATLEREYVIQLNKDTKEQIKKDGAATLVELILRESHRRDLCHFLGDDPDVIELIGKSNYSSAIILYILKRDPHHPDEVLKKFPNLREVEKEKIMSGLAMIRKEGFELGAIRGKQEGIKEGIKEGFREGIQKGRQEGKQESMQEVAKRMLENGIEREIIAKVTGLGLADIDKLKET